MFKTGANASIIGLPLKKRRGLMHQRLSPSSALEDSYNVAGDAAYPDDFEFNLSRFRPKALPLGNVPTPGRERQPGESSM